MGKLNIAHHKSYHPYRADNIARVRRDEEEAKLKEAKEEGRLMLADAEARIDLLRERSSAKSRRRPSEKEEFAAAREAAAVATTSGLPVVGGHINFFEDLEHQSSSAAVQASRASKKAVPAPVETEKGFALAPSQKDLKPWYSSKSGDETHEPDKGRKSRDLARKSTHDPLTFINDSLSSRTSSSLPAPTRNQRGHRPPAQPTPSSSAMAPPIPPTPSDLSSRSARLERESSERERARELIRRRKLELAGSETPSTVHGGASADGGYGYGDMYNKVEVEEAHRGRTSRAWGNPRERQRGWDGRARSAEGRKERRW